MSIFSSRAQDCRAVAEQAAKLDGVRKVLHRRRAASRAALAEEIGGDLIVPLMQNYDVLLAPATTMGKNVLPRVAALLDVAQVSDIVEVKAPDTFVRPVYAGNALETVEDHRQEHRRHGAHDRVRRGGRGRIRLDRER